MANTNWMRRLLVVGIATGALAVVGCEEHHGRVYVGARVDVAAPPPPEVEVSGPAVAVDIDPNVFIGYYNTPPGADFYYSYRFDGRFHYLDYYHRGPGGRWVIEHSYRAPRAAIHHDFSAHDHARFEHPRR